MDLDIHQLLASQDYRRAFEVLLGRYQQKVFHLALSMLRQEAPAEDLAQDIFLRIWKGLPGYDGRAALSTWVYAVSRNACLTELSRRRARLTVSLHDPAWEQAVDALPWMQSHDAEPTAPMDSSTLLAGLPEKYRRVITLFYLEQKSYEQTADLLGLPLGTVKTHLHRAKKELLRLAARPAAAALPSPPRFAHDLR
jgi:RNA polymerase sigma-70 factor (ECF subfamily)